MSAGPDLASARCLHHPQREAAALCTGCRRACCRECATEHAGRIVCAACLASATTLPVRSGRRLAPFVSAARLAGGVFVAWLYFHLVSRVLLFVPDFFRAVIPHAGGAGTPAP